MRPDTVGVAVARGFERAFEIITTNRLNYQAAFVFDVICPLVMAYLGWRQGAHWQTAVASLFAGAFLFSLIEYAIHRWLFHSPASFMTPIHFSHHIHPTRPTALPFFMSAGSGFLFWLLLTPFLDQGPLFWFLSGLLGGYLCYSTVHHLEHHTQVNTIPLPWLHRRNTLHRIHHGLYRTNYGVTTSFWDHVFGTYYRSTKSP